MTTTDTTDGTHRLGAERGDPPFPPRRDPSDLGSASVATPLVDHGDELDVFDDIVDPRLRARWVEARRAEGRRRLYVICGVVGTAALLVIAYVIAHSSLLGAGTIEVRGVTGTGAATVRAAAGISDGAPLLFLDEGAVARRVEQLPAVAHARVSTELPSTVTIRVTLRVPVGWTRSANPTPPRVAVLDGDGRVLARTTAPPPGLVHVVGVGEPGALGSRVPRVGALRAIETLPAALRAQVVRLVLRPTDGPVLVLGPGAVAREIQLGTFARLDAKATAASAVLEALAAQGTHVRILGVQVPDAPFTRA